MNIYSWLQLTLFITALILLAKPLGNYMARVYQSERVFLDRVLDSLERKTAKCKGAALLFWTAPCFWALCIFCSEQHI